LHRFKTPEVVLSMAKLFYAVIACVILSCLRPASAQVQRRQAEKACVQNFMDGLANGIIPIVGHITSGRYLNAEITACNAAEALSMRERASEICALRATSFLLGHTVGLGAFLAIFIAAYKHYGFKGSAAVGATLSALAWWSRVNNK
jgi:hypothetical protein